MLARGPGTRRVSTSCGTLSCRASVRSPRGIWSGTPPSTATIGTSAPRRRRTRAVLEEAPGRAER
eukprot:9480510-Lingulodinium_polyedra.AAC.1